MRIKLFEEFMSKSNESSVSSLIDKYKGIRLSDLDHYKREEPKMYKTLQSAAKKLGVKWEDSYMVAAYGTDDFKKAIKDFNDKHIKYVLLGSIDDELDGSEEDAIIFKGEGILNENILKNDKGYSKETMQVVQGIADDYGTCTEEDAEYAIDDYASRPQAADIDEIVAALKHFKMLVDEKGKLVK